ncbi:MAG: PIG-L family deacetylase [Armatimonadetes bacterium]|nr:MAG: PIG-L family deacetylase [Armatimonadota bacterium]
MTADTPAPDTFDELAPPLASLVTPRRAMTIGAHPDDAEFGAGATLARWASEGCAVTILVVTDGSKGSWNEDEDQNALVVRRINEQDAAADVLGAQATIHLGYVDGELEYSMALRQRIAIEILKVRPDVVLTHDPWQRYQMHPDHRVTGLAAVDGVVTAREPLALTDSGLSAHRPEAILLWSADEPDHAELVDEEWLEVKVKALLCHSSQGETTMGGADVSPDRADAFASQIRAWHTTNGKKLGVGPAEVFKRLKP